MIFGRKASAVLTRIETGMVQAVAELKERLDLAGSVQKETRTEIRDRLDGLLEGQAEKTREEEETRRVLGKHTIAVEDMLDEWEELREEQKNLMGELRTELSGLRETKEEAWNAQEASLLNLLWEDQMQFDLLGSMLEENPEWQRQFALLAEKQEVMRRAAGLEFLGNPGEPVDYETHEILEVIPAGDESLDKRVAAVYERGYRYQGQVRKKAKVSVYKYQKTVP